MNQLDEKDMAIMDVLKENSGLSIQKIAKKTGIPIATVHNRIKRLREGGVIQRYTIIIDKAKLGRKMTAHIHIKCVPKVDHIALLEKIMKHGLVEDGSAVAGEYDLLLKVRVKDMEELNELVLKYLRTYDEISQTETMIAFRHMEKD